MFFIGLFIMAYGIVMMLRSELGLAPWNVLEVGLHKQFGLTIGRWAQIVGAAIVLITTFMRRRLPGPGTLLNMICVGFFIDLIMFQHWVPDVSSMPMRVAFLIVGLVVLGSGMGMYLAPELGEGPRDGIMIELSSRFSWSVRKVRTVMEISVLVIGWLLGGPVGVGTVVISISLGYLMQFFMQWWKRWLKQKQGRGVIHENFN